MGGKRRRGRPVIDIIKRLVRAAQTLRREKGRGATTEELAAALDLSRREVDAAIKVAKGMVLMELPAEEQDDEARESGGTPEGGFTAREERVLCMRFGIRLEIDPALERLGRQLLETRKRVRDLEQKAAREPQDPEAS